MRFKSATFACWSNSGIQIRDRENGALPIRCSSEQHCTGWSPALPHPCQYWKLTVWQKCVWRKWNETWNTLGSTCCCPPFSLPTILPSMTNLLILAHLHLPSPVVGDTWPTALPLVAMQRQPTCPDTHPPCYHMSLKPESIWGYSSWHTSDWVSFSESTWLQCKVFTSNPYSDKCPIR